MILAKDILNIARIVVRLCIGMITGNAQIVDRKFILMRMITMEL